LVHDRKVQFSSKLIVCSALFVVFFMPRPVLAQATLNLSQDLVRLGIAATNMTPNQPALDAGPLLFQGVQYANQQGIPLVIADPGVYYFLSLQNPNWHVELVGISNITIDLRGSDLIFTHPFSEALYIGYNTNAVFQNFTVDYQPLPFTQVSVVSVNPNAAQITYAVQPGWQDPSTFNSAPSGTNIEVHIFRNGQPAPGTRRMAAQNSISGNLITIIPYDINPTPQNMSMIRPGDVAVVAMRANGVTLAADRCIGCTFRNISIYSGTNAAIQTYFSSSSTLERIYMIPKPGTDRLVSAFGINSETPGPNSRIRLSRAIRSMDDGFGLFSWVNGSVQSQPSARTLTVAGVANTALSWIVNIPNGSPVVFERPIDGAILGSATVVSQTAISTSSQPYVVTYTFDQDLPSGLVGSYIYTTDPNLRGANSVVERNMVLSSAGCCDGIDLGGWASNSTVHGNYIRRVAFSGIIGNQHLEESSSDDRSEPLVNLTISNNVIDGALLSPVLNLWWLEFGGIQMDTLTSDKYGYYNLMTGSPHQNIAIANNFIADAGRSAVWVGNTAGGNIGGNYLLHPGDRPDLADAYPAYSADVTKPLVIDTTSSGIVTGNNPIDQTSGIMFVTDTQYRELAAYAPGSTIRLNAYNVGTLSNPAVTFTDADGQLTALTIQNAATHALDVTLPAGAGLGGAFVTLTSGGAKYFGTLFVDSQDNIPALNGCTYEVSASSSSVAATAGNLPILVVTQSGCSYQAADADSFVTVGAPIIGTGVIPVGFALNAGGSRATTIEIAGLPINVTQASAVAPVSVTPSSGVGLSQNFAALYSDVNGFSGINTAMLNVSVSSSVANACVVEYIRGTNQLLLMNDAGSGSLGPGTPGSAGTLQNSQCTLNLQSSSVAAAGNNLTVNYALTFEASFMGSKSIFMNVSDNANVSSGWQAMGTWTVGVKKTGGQLTSQ
jgi:hypothetical protein